MSLLLALPGELRNRIYEIAVNSCQDAPAHLRHISRGPFPANRPKDWCELTRAFLGLTQTCRQIRKEFLAIHQTRVKVCVDITGIERYCSDILSHHQLGNLVIGHDGSWKGGVFCDEDMEINVLELILLTSRCKDVNVEWAEGALPYGWDETFLTQTDTQYRFLNYLTERVDKVEFGAVKWGTEVPNEYFHGIDILVVYPKKQYIENWMRHGFGLPLDEWLEDNPTTQERIEEEWWGPLTEEEQKNCDWVDKYTGWCTQLMPITMPIVPWVQKRYRSE